MNRKPFTSTKRPLRDDMTLCIAANVRSLDGDAIVCCFDFRIETQTSGSNTGYKFRKISPDWAALLAGSTSNADRLLDLFVHEFSAKDISQLNALNEIRKVIAIYRRELVEEYVQSVLSMSYQECLDNRDKIPATVLDQLFHRITEIQLDCEILLFCLKYKCPFIYAVEGSGLADQFRNFRAHWNRSGKCRSVVAL